MNVSRMLTALAVVMTFTAGTAHLAAQQGPPMPKPGPEHVVFNMDVGTWDAVVEASQGPGAPLATSKGVEVNTLGCGGLCLITDFKGEMMPGTAFHGHGIFTWDATKKKYLAGWTDSMSTGLARVESTWDAKAKKLTGTMEGPGMSGEVVKMRTVVEYPSPTSRIMSAYGPGPDGKEVLMLKITYTKRK
jgi:hypothetical protein